MFNSIERLISFRNLKPQKKEGFLKVISIFSFVGIMLGVAILIIVMSVMNGFRTDFTNKILGFNPHLTIKSYDIGISEKFKKELKLKFNLNSECIYNPLNKKEIIKSSKRKIKIKFFNKKSFKIISIARFSDQKDHLCIIKSIHLLRNKYKNIKVLLIGSGDKKKKILNKIDELRLNKINNGANLLLNRVRQRSLIEIKSFK